MGEPWGTLSPVAKEAAHRGSLLRTWPQSSSASFLQGNCGLDGSQEPPECPPVQGSQQAPPEPVEHTV